MVNNHEALISDHGAFESGAVGSEAAGWDVLFTREGWSFLEQIQESFLAGESLLSLNLLLRKQGVPPEHVAALVNQLELQHKATQKFGTDAYGMLFTKAGLEQASGNTLASLHAKRFRELGHNVWDLGCGIGSQSRAFAQTGIPVVAVEIDQLTAKIAEHNLKSKSANTNTVINADATQVDIPASAALFFDPARRTIGHKNTKRVSAADYSPSLTHIFEKMRKHSGAVKLGPAFDHELLPGEAETQWISVNGGLKETVLWFGELKQESSLRSAVVIKETPDSHNIHTLSATKKIDDAPLGSVGSYIYEPDSAIIRSRLIPQVAEEVQGRMLDHKIAYITSDVEVRTPFAVGFKILEEIPSKPKHLAKHLKQLNVGSLEIKKRGVNVDPPSLRKALNLKGNRSATIIMTRVGEKHVAYLVERI